jgi:hypothetical protein
VKPTSKPLCDEVDDGVVDEDVELDVRVGLMERGEDRLDIGPEGVPQAAHTHHAGWAFPEMPDVRQGRVELGQGWPHTEQQALARLRESHAARRAMEQADAKALLEGADDLTERGWRQAELLRGLGKAALLGDSDEGAKVSVPAGSHSEKLR